MINGELLGDASKMKLNLLTALHFIVEAWRLIHQPPYRNASRSMYGCSSDSEYIDVSNDMLNEQEEDY